MVSSVLIDIRHHIKLIVIYNGSFVCAMRIPSQRWMQIRLKVFTMIQIGLERAATSIWQA